MHQFKIIYTDYTPEGAPTANSHVVYCDTAEQAEVKYNELNKLYRSVTDPETGEEIKKYKAYKVVLHTAAYKQIEDATAFFSQFHI